MRLSRRGMTLSVTRFDTAFDTFLFDDKLKLRMRASKWTGPSVLSGCYCKGALCKSTATDQSLEGNAFELSGKRSHCIAKWRAGSTPYIAAQAHVAETTTVARHPRKTAMWRRSCTFGRQQQTVRFHDPRNGVKKQARKD